MRKEILNIAKKHYLNKDWYTGWSTNTDWQKCIFEAVKELYDDASETYTETAYVLLKAANLKITEEDKEIFANRPSYVCLKIMDKYYKKPIFVSGMEIE